MPRDIDQIIEMLKVAIPGIHIKQLHVKHPGVDDDGLWFIHIPGREEKVQIESSTGVCPFLIESDFNSERLHGNSVEEVVSTIKQLYNQNLL